MNDPRNNKSNPTSRVAALIVTVVLIVIATLLYNALKGKREYDRENASDARPVSVPAEVASAALAASAATPASH
ncbi:MAG TPA: hypothetical protein VGZ01_10200 [Trinickia sp.]|jgi:hypothetical protein|nr:hypothetical protein [Trinickia sp.]